MRVSCLVIFIIVLSCKGPAINDENQGEYKDSLRVDSLKWLMYALNHNGKLKALDSSSNSIQYLSPLECEAEMINKFKHNDTLACAFRFYKHGFSGFLPDYALPVRAIGVYNHTYYLDFYHLKPDFTNHHDSVKLYINNSEKLFKEYLKNYHGEISPWLKKEAIRRKVL